MDAASPRRSIAHSWRQGMAAAQPYGCSCCPAHCPAALRLFARIVFARIERVLHGPAPRTTDAWPNTSQGSAMGWATAALAAGDPPPEAVSGATRHAARSRAETVRPQACAVVVPIASRRPVGRAAAQIDLFNPGRVYDDAAGLDEKFPERT